ncbi:MAG: phospholipid-binding protein MlaC [Qingshengfaniella sp.]
MTLSRRNLMLGLSGSALLAAMPTLSFALTPQAAETLVRQVAADITRTINSGRSETQLYGDFEQIFERYADVPTIARYSLGAAARGVSASDMRAYTAAFSHYISRKYGRRFREFIGGEIVVQGSRTEKTMVIVNSVAKLRGESPIKVEFLLSDQSGRAAFFNVIIEGVNMLTTERTEIGALLDQQGGSVSKLTQRLQATS